MINIPYPKEDILENFFESVKDKLLKRIKAIKSQNTVSFKYKKIRVTTQTKEILSWLENEGNLKEIILLKPDKLISLIDIVERKYKNARYSKDSLNKILYRIFVEYGYDNIDKLEFIKNIGLGSCPYCNRNYIFHVNKKNSIKPEIDHLYPKSLYPYLACSYFNLIPSCPSCNGFGAKEAKDTFHVYPITNPYNIKENDFKFSITPKSIDFFSFEKKKYDFEDFEIELYGNKDNIDIFQLEELYKQHKDVVLEVLIKKMYYPESYVKELASFGFEEDEIYQYLFSNYKKEEDLHKRPLSKLIKDIVEELNQVKIDVPIKKENQNKKAKILDLGFAFGV